MGLETATHISDLNSAYPVGATDSRRLGDDHIRLVKAVLLTDFANISGAVTSSHAELNLLDGTTAGTAVAGKAIAVDGSKDIAGLNVVTAASFVGPLTGAVTGNVTGNVTGDVTGDLTGNVTATSVLADGVTATTQSASDGSTKVATTKYADDQVATLLQWSHVSETATTSGGTAVSGAISATATAVKIVFQGVSISALRELDIEVKGSSYSTTYAGGTSTLDWPGAAGGISVGGGNVAAADVCSGVIELSKLDDNVWGVSGNVYLTSTNVTGTAGGTVALDGALSEVTLDIFGTGSFDAGSFHVLEYS